MTDLAVTDTHALIWYASGAQRRLGAAARRLFRRLDEGRVALYVPTLVVVEVSELVRLGRVGLATGFPGWEEALFRSGRFFSASLTREVVRRAESLYRLPERGDRLIAATAAELGCPLVTRDREVGDAAGVEVIW